MRGIIMNLDTPVEPGGNTRVVYLRFANAVDLPGHPAIRRQPADAVREDTDLGSRPVVTRCSRLCAEEVDRALARGLARAEAMVATGHIRAAALFLQGRSTVAGAGGVIEIEREAADA